MAESDVLAANLLVKTTGEDDALVQELGQNIGDADAIGEEDGGHGVSLVLGLGGNDLEAEVSDGLLDLVGNLDVALEHLGHGARQDLADGGVQGVDELWRRGGEVRGLLGLVVLHD